MQRFGEVRGRRAGRVQQPQPSQPSSWTKRTAPWLAVLALACGAEPKTSSTPVAAADYAGHHLVLLSVDTLRADHLGAYGYDRDTSPHIDRLATESVLFERAQVPRGLTWPSLVTFLTGLYPMTTNVRSNGDLLADDIPTLATLLHERGYRTGAFLANACDAFGRDFDRKVCGRDEKVNRKAIDWLERQATDEPLFLWVHYGAPHEEYRPPARYDVFGDREYRGPARGSRAFLDRITMAGLDLPEPELQRVVALYDGEIRLVDTLIADLWQVLEARGVLDRAIVVLTADHGEELGQHHRYYYHACSIYDAVLHVPLLIRLPDGRQAGRRIPEIVESVDLAPTLLSLLDLELPPDLPGKTMLPLMNREPGAEEAFGSAVAEWYRPDVGEVTSLRTDRWRYIHNPENRVPECKPVGRYFRVEDRELYDHDTDGREAHDVVEHEPDVAAELEAELVRRIEQIPRRQERMRASPEVIERLEALGYLGDE